MSNVTTPFTADGRMRYRAHLIIADHYAAYLHYSTQAYALEQSGEWPRLAEEWRHAARLHRRAARDIGFILAGRY